jgi:predicted lipid-binding transport protein (Tim44 family)
MPGNILVGLAIGVIIIGFIILAGVAFWLALERRRALSAGPGQSAPQRGSQPAAPQQRSAPPANQEQKAAPAAAQPAAPAPSATPENASSAAPATPKAQKDVHPSGEYPSAASYDQTILPEPPRRRTRQRPQ